MAKPVESSVGRKRVKVYKLAEDGGWEDKGTGHVECLLLEKLDGIGLLVKSEKNTDEILLEAKISPEINYHQQQDTLIVWNEPDTDTDLALSFQEAECCKAIWENICQVQKMESSNGGHISDDGDILNTSAEVEDTLESTPGLELPSTNLNNLQKILEVVTQSLNTPPKRERLAQAILKENYLPKLIELFRICEDLEVTENLHIIFNIFKSLVMLNDTALYEELLSDANLLDVMGALEYDPAIAKPASHRE